MFVLVTVITLIIQGVLRPFWPERALNAHDPASFTIFWSVSWLASILYMMWGLSLVMSVLPGDRRPDVLRFVARLGANSNMQVLQTLLFIGAVLLMGSGWFTGNVLIFVPGTILTLGLLGNSIEQGRLSGSSS